MTKDDPMLNHKCEMLAKVHNMGPDRDMWLGKLTEPIPGHESETHCLHIKTPYKSVIWGVNLGDLMAYAVLAHIAHGDLVKEDTPINGNWLKSMAEVYKKCARGEVTPRNEANK